MKYVAAVVASILVLVLFAFFAAAIGWRHGGGMMVQSFLWMIVAAVWVTVTKNWDAILARFQKSGNSRNPPPILATGYSQVIVAGVILILIAAMFATIVSKLGAPSATEIAQEAAKIVGDEQGATQKKENATDYTYRPWDRPKNPTEKEWLLLDLIANQGDSRDIEVDGFTFMFGDQLGGAIKCTVLYTLKSDYTTRQQAIGILKQHFELYKKQYPWAEFEIEEKMLRPGY